MNNDMAVHGKVLGWIFALTHVLGCLLAIAFLAFGSLILPAAGMASGTSAGATGGMLGGGFIDIIAFVFLAMALPGFLCGVGLLKFRPWARTLCIILSILELAVFPLGTAMGIYGLVVMFDAKTVALLNGYTTY
jgi:glucan phosphoethanolaminetransferase (alkaline phosphatase superfamily)